MLENSTNKLVYEVKTSKVFAFPVPFISPSDISCYLETDVDGVERKLAAGEFTVESKSDYSAGADITLTIPLPVGKKLAIVRECPITQLTDFPEFGRFPASANEKALDKLTMICQQLKEAVGRCLSVSITGESSNLLESFTAISSAVDEAVRAANSSAQAAGAAQGAAMDGSAAADRAAAAADRAEAVLDKTGGVPVGAIFASPGAVPPEGAYLLNGQTITNCRELYPKFFEWVQTAGVRVIDNATFEAELVSAGVCGGFVVDETAGSVRLPSIMQGTLWGADNSSVGQSLAAGLPNITGSQFTVQNTARSAQGAFDDSGHNLGYSAGGGIKVFAGNTVFDASRSNPIYGASDTVQPPAIRASWCIQVFNAATALSEQESARLASEMQIKAQTDLANVAEPVQAFKEMTTGWCAPDWANKQSKILYTTYTAESDGWIIYDGQETGATDTTFDAYINKELIIHFYHNQDSDGVDICIPIAKGDTYRLTDTAGANRYYLVPVKG